LGFLIFDLFISLGVGHAYALLRFVALYYLLFDRKVRTETRQYVDAMWNYPSFSKRIILTYKLFLSAGEKLIDLRIWETSVRKVELICDISRMKEIVTQGEGLIFFTSHVGNWQLMMRELPNFGVDVAILKRRETNDSVEDFLKIDTHESTTRIKIIDAEDGFNATISVMRELAAGNIVSIMGDVPYRNSKIISVDFLGSLIDLPEGPFRLAAACKSPIMVLFAKKTAPCKYLLINEEMDTHTQAIDGNDVKNDKPRLLAQKYAATLEAFLIENPFEWTPGGRL
jgi:predicted LPLAT superfamily acyltransferase